MLEVWKSIPGLGDKYEISNLGRVKSKSFMQRYTHWRTGKELFRKTKERILAQQLINSGYFIVHLWYEDKRVVKTVHRLVAQAFHQNYSESLVVNHIDFDKKNNRADNLECITTRENVLHSLYAGRNPQAIAVIDVTTGEAYPSITQASKSMKKACRTIRRGL